MCKRLGCASWPHCPIRSSWGPHKTSALFLRFVGRETKVQRHQITFIKVLLLIGDNTRVWTWAFCPPVSVAPWNTLSDAAP